MATQRCCSMCKETKLLLIRIFLCAIYVFGGCTVFLAIEETESPSINKTAMLLKIKQNTTARFNMSDDDFRYLIRALAEATSPDPDPWDYSKAATFAIHLVTTIGYGNISPKTTTGQMVTILYGLVGIPLALLMFKSIGQRYNGRMRRTVVWFETRYLKRTQVQNREGKTVVVNAVAVITWMCISAASSMGSDKWTFWEGLYVWFITFTTVGFGDYVPKSICKVSETTIGLCLMSGLIDSLVLYSEKANLECSRCRNCFSCFRPPVSHDSVVDNEKCSPAKEGGEMDLENSSNVMDIVRE